MKACLGIGLALVPGLALATGDAGGCVTLASARDGTVLARVDLPAHPPVFVLRYLHSVTRTPVAERYRIDGSVVVQSEIRFEQHGPGLPTAADAGGQWRREGDGFVVTMERSFPVIRMRVDPGQSPQLIVTGGRGVDLARLGPQSIVLTGAAGACPGPVPTSGE